jgi:hypothetical protein
MIPGPDPWALKTLFYVEKKKKKTFADVIKLRILRQSDYPTLSTWNLKIITCLQKRARGRSEPHSRGKRNVTRKAEIRGMQPQAKECQQPTSSWDRQGIDWPLEPLEGTRSCHTLISLSDTDFRLQDFRL